MKLGCFLVHSSVPLTSVLILIFTALIRCEAAPNDSIVALGTDGSGMDGGNGTRGAFSRCRSSFSACGRSYHTLLGYGRRLKTLKLFTGDPETAMHRGQLDVPGSSFAKRHEKHERNIQ